jgi:hypothetical protein
LEQGYDFCVDGLRFIVFLFKGDVFQKHDKGGREDYYPHIFELLGPRHMFFLTPKESKLSSDNDDENVDHKYFFLDKL